MHWRESDSAILVQHILSGAACKNREFDHNGCWRNRCHLTRGTYLEEKKTWKKWCFRLTILSLLWLESNTCAHGWIKMTNLDYSLLSVLLSPVRFSWHSRKARQNYVQVKNTVWNVKFKWPELVLMLVIMVLFYDKVENDIN